jgi:NADH-quinone oxidoreductase subunit L
MVHEAGGHMPSYQHLLEPKEHNVWLEIFLMLFSSVVAITGIALAYIFYVKRPDLPGKVTKGQWGYDIVRDKYRVDELYDETIVKPIVEGSKVLWKDCDARGIDGTVLGVAKIIGWFGDRGRVLQSGLVRNYALFIVMGFVILLLIAF